MAVLSLDSIDSLDSADDDDDDTFTAFNKSDNGSAQMLEFSVKINATITAPHNFDAIIMTAYD